MKPQKYISLNNKKYEITFRDKKTISDKGSFFYRFQIIRKDIVFGYDFTITNKKIIRYRLIEDDIIELCFRLVKEFLNKQIEGYCSIKISNNDIIQFLKETGNTDRIDEMF